MLKNIHVSIVQNCFDLTTIEKRHQGMCIKKTRLQNIHETAELQKELLKNSALYKEQLELGQAIAKCLHENKVIVEESLSEEHKRALQCYQQARQTIDMDVITLRPWQVQTLKLVQNQTQRKVIWVVGKQGNEGETFMQHYIRHHYGDRRVVVTDIAGRKKDIAHYLSKLPLECKDIFLFNHPASS